MRPSGECPKSASDSRNVPVTRLPYLPDIACDPEDARALACQRVETSCRTWIVSHSGSIKMTMPSSSGITASANGGIMLISSADAYSVPRYWGIVKFFGPKNGVDPWSGDPLPETGRPPARCRRHRPGRIEVPQGGWQRSLPCAVVAHMMVLDDNSVIDPRPVLGRVRRRGRRAGRATFSFRIRALSLWSAGQGQHQLHQFRLPREPVL